MLHWKSSDDILVLLSVSLVTTDIYVSHIVVDLCAALTQGSSVICDNFITLSYCPIPLYHMNEG